MGRKEKERASFKSHSCQVIIGQHHTDKCRAAVPSGSAKWCDYHIQMRKDLHTSFCARLMEYRATEMPLPDMAVVRETMDLEWLAMLVEPMRKRLAVLKRCVANRNCFMGRMLEEDLKFGTRNTARDLHAALVRLGDKIKIIEHRMYTLILCTAYETQNPVAGLSAQLLHRIDKVNQRCSHSKRSKSAPDSNILYPIARRHHRRVAEKGVVDSSMDEESMLLRKFLLTKLGVQVTEDNLEEGLALVVYWDSLVDHERAHIAAAYFRRVIFNEPNLFVRAHYHTSSFKSRTIDLPRVFTTTGDILDPADDMDESMLCMIMFILGPSLDNTHLQTLYEYISRPAYFEVRTAAQDVILDIRAFQAQMNKPHPPYWAYPIRKIFFEHDDDPSGALHILCGTLHEAAFHQSVRGDTLEPRFWSHIASLIGCGKCLFAMVHRSDEWCNVVRSLAVHRVPLFDRVLPQVVGSVPSGLWGMDQADTRDQAPRSYRMDNLLEMAGLAMLGIIEGGPVDTHGIDHRRKQFMQDYILLPQVWFALPNEQDPTVKATLRELMVRSRAPGAPFTVRVRIRNNLGHDSSVPDHFNALRRSSSTWVPTRLELSELRMMGRMRYDPLPRRIAGDICLVEMSYKFATRSQPGIESILELLLDVCMHVHHACTTDDLADKLEHLLERSGLANRNHKGNFTCAFDLDRIMPPSPDSSGDHDKYSPLYFDLPLSDTALPDDLYQSISVARAKTNGTEKCRTEWFDLMMDTEADSLPDLTEWTR